MLAMKQAHDMFDTYRRCYYEACVSETLKSEEGVTNRALERQDRPAHA